MCSILSRIQYLRTIYYTYFFLSSLQRILQPYVDALLDSIFAVPQGRPLPKAIKYLFDFLDLQASDLGIQDPEILHTWKTNRYASTGTVILSS